MTTPTPHETQTLDSLRTRLLTLSTTLSTLTAILQTSNPLPPYPHIQETFTSIVREIHSLTTFMKSRKVFLDSTVVYPLPSCQWVGGRKEVVAGELGRKMRSRGWEGWVGSAVRDAEEAGLRGMEVDAGTRMSVEERRDLWSSAAELARPVLEEIPKGMDYTMEELVNGVENVETGLRRRLNMGEKVVVDEGEERVELGVALPVEDVLRFMTRGERPRRSGLFLE